MHEWIGRQRRTAPVKTALTAATLLVVVALAATAWIFRGYLTPFVPDPTRSGMEGLTVPPGFTIHLYAPDVPGARSLALGPGGTVFVGSRGAGRVYAVTDRDGDQRAETIRVVAEGLNMPNGVAVRDGDLYVAEVSRVLRFPGLAADPGSPATPEVIRADYPQDTHHGWKFIAFGPDGRLYVPVGAPCNVCAPDPATYAVITRLSPDGARREVFARGVRNTVGFDWHPDTGELWLTDNGRDWMGPDRPPDELNHAPRPGLHFGFPFCHGTDIPDPELNGGRSCEGFEAPALELGPHVAALGMRFYDADAFPPRYRGGVFIAEHGSWNRREPIGYRVTFVPFAAGEPAGYEVFAAGWLDGDLASGRPVDVLVLPDGSLLVSDDKGGRIYRIAYEG